MMSSKLVGQVIENQFRVDSFIDAGGMGSVFRVWDLQRNVPLAMKVLHADLAEDPAMFKRFKREARALQRLAHPNIVQFFGLYQTSEFAFLLERFIDGPTLKDVLRKKGGQPLPPKEAIIYLKAICSALGYAHANGVIHCDVKPGNVMIDRGGGIYLADFGIARHADSTSTTMAGAGTPAYMAPEQILSKSVSATTDIYALGIMAYELFSGQRPFRGTERGTEGGGATANERIRHAQIKLAPPDPRSLNSSISPSLSAVILKALEKEPERRQQSCQEFFIAICQALGEDPDLIPDRAGAPGLAEHSSGPAPSPIPGNYLPPKPAGPGVGPRKNVGVFIALGAVALIILVIALASGGGGNTGGIPSSPSDPGGGKPPANSRSTSTRAVTNSRPTNTPTSVFAEPTRTLVPSNTPPRPTATKVPSSCPGAEPQRVEVGDRAEICTKSDNVVVRADPQSNGREYFRIPPGSEVTILEGPRCSDNSSWWYVRVPAGTWYAQGSPRLVGTLDSDEEGWIREGSDRVDRYYMCKLP